MDIRRLRVSIIILCSLLVVAFFTAKGYSEVDFALQQEEALNFSSSTSPSWSPTLKSKHGRELGREFGAVQEALREAEPLAFEELQTNLSSLETDDSLSPIGEYQLSADNRDSLNSALLAIEEKGYQVGFLMVDTTTGYGVSYNVDTEFYSASSIKGVYVASLASELPESLESSSSSMNATVEYSDNDEYIFLRTTYSGEPLKAWCEEVGVASYNDGEWYPYYSARTLAKLWLRTYEYFESESEDAEEVASWYSATLNSSIFNTLGSLYSVHTKAGWIYDMEFSSTVDAGVVYADAGPYIIAILTDMPSNMPMLDPLVLALDETHESMTDL